MRSIGLENWMNKDELRFLNDKFIPACIVKFNVKKNSRATVIVIANHINMNKLT